MEIRAHDPTTKAATGASFRSGGTVWSPMDRDVEEQPDGHPLPRETAARAPADLDARRVAALERTGHALRVLLWEQAKTHGLSPIQVQLVLRLADEPAERRRVGQLAAELDVKAPTVSDAVAALRRKHLVATEQEAGDKRISTLSLTARGRDLVAELADWQRAVAAELERVGEHDKAQTLQMLLDVIGALQRQGVISVARMCTTCRFFDRDRNPGATHPHRCLLLEVPLAAGELRVDCAEHELAQ